MKNVAVVCLVVLVLGQMVLGTAPVSGPAPETFELADRIGEPNARAFFLFSTSAGSYTIRQDGMGEVASPKHLRRVFYLKFGAKGRLERVYFLEHEGDLLLLCELSNGSCLVRLEQKKRTPRWQTSLPDAGPFQPPLIDGGTVDIKEDRENGNTIRINKRDGSIAPELER